MVRDRGERQRQGDNVWNRVWTMLGLCQTSGKQRKKEQQGTLAVDSCVAAIVN